MGENPKLYEMVNYAMDNIGAKKLDNTPNYLMEDINFETGHFEREKLPDFKKNLLHIISGVYNMDPVEENSLSFVLKKGNERFHLPVGYYLNLNVREYPDGTIDVTVTVDENAAGGTVKADYP